MKTSTALWIAGGAVVLLGGGTAIFLATRSDTKEKPPNQKIGDGTNAPPTKPAPKSPPLVASANMAELGSFAAWLANNPPGGLNPPDSPDAGSY